MTKRLITRHELRTADTTPYALSKDIDYALSSAFKKLKADMISNPGQTYMLEINTVETE